MLQNAYFLAKIGADTAENEQHFAENFAKNWQLPYGSARRGAAHRGPKLRSGGGHALSGASCAG